MLHRPYLLLLLTALIWGGHAVIGKLAVADIAPMTLTVLRWAVACLCLLPFAVKQILREWQHIKPHLIWLSAFAMLGFSGFNMLFYSALEHTSALNVALIQATTPMLILLINTVLLRQPFALWQLLGMGMAFVGVLVILSQGKLSVLLQLALNKGDLLMLIACLLYASYSAGLRYKPNISWLSFMFILSLAASLSALPFAIYEIANSTKPTFHFCIESILFIAYVGFLASIVSQLAYAKAVHLIGASRAGFAINLVPIFGAFMAVVFLGEPLQGFHILSLALVIGGISISERHARRHSSPLT